MKILMIGPHKDLIKGGMSTVIKNYNESKYLEDIDIYTLASVIPGNKIKKMIQCIYSIFKMIYYIEFKNIDIIHIHTASGKSFFRKCLFIRLSRILKSKVILHIHGGGFEEFYENNNSIFNKNKITKYLNYCNEIIVLSENWKKKISKMTKTNITVINNSVEEQCIKHTLEQSNRIVFIGRIEKEKGIYDLVEVAKKIIEDGKVIKFIICGDGEKSQLRRILTQYGIEQNFELLGWVDKERVVNELKKAMIFILPSHKEAMPMSILEAMSLGIPIISTNVGSIPEFVIDQRNGFLVDPQDIKSLKKYIEILYNNNELRKEIRMNNIMDLKNKYSNSINHKKLKKVYYNILTIR